MTSFLFRFTFPAEKNSAAANTVAELIDGGRRWPAAGHRLQGAVDAVALYPLRRAGDSPLPALLCYHGPAVRSKKQTGSFGRKQAESIARWCRKNKSHRNQTGSNGAEEGRTLWSRTGSGGAETAKPPPRPGRRLSASSSFPSGTALPAPRIEFILPSLSRKHRRRSVRRRRCGRYRLFSRSPFRSRSHGRPSCSNSHNADA